jgi:hypothetical protein
MSYGNCYHISQKNVNKNIPGLPARSFKTIELQKGIVIDRYFVELALPKNLILLLVDYGYGLWSREIFLGNLTSLVYLWLKCSIEG